MNKTETFRFKPNLERIGEEFDFQDQFNNPYKLIRDTFNNFDKGPLILALGAVGGGGAGEKAIGLLEQFIAEKVPFCVVAMEKYLADNPAIASFLKTRPDIRSFAIRDDVSRSELYEVSQIALDTIERAYGEVSGVLSLGPRTYYPEAARRLGIPSMIIDGAVPDKWETDLDPATGMPDTEYYLPAYQESVFATTCGFTGWSPQKEKYPEGMNLKIVSQPFSEKKISYLRELRKLNPQECRERLMAKNSIAGLDAESLIVVPTMDQVYLNPEALSVFGRFLTPEQFGQSVGFMAELITSLTKLDRNSLFYLRPGAMKETLTPLLERFVDGERIKIIGPIAEVVPNEDWLLLRKAGVTIGRAPLCVSTAEALGMGDYQITAAVPGTTSDGISYMTEPEALKVLARKGGVSRVLFPGESLIEAIGDVIKTKKL